MTMPQITMRKEDLEAFYAWMVQTYGQAQADAILRNLASPTQLFTSPDFQTWLTNFSTAPVTGEVLQYDENNPDYIRKLNEANEYGYRLRDYLDNVVAKGQITHEYGQSIIDMTTAQMEAAVNDRTIPTAVTEKLPYYNYVSTPDAFSKSVLTLNKGLGQSAEADELARREYQQQQANEQDFRNHEIYNTQREQQQRVSQLPTAGDAYTGFLDKFMSPNMRRYFAGAGSDVFNDFNKANPNAFALWQRNMATPDITTQYAKENLSQLQYVTQPQTEQMYADLVSPEERAAFQPQLDTLKQQRSNLESTISERESQPRQIEQDPFSKYLSAYPFLNKYLSVSPSMRGESTGRYRQPTRLTR